MRSSLSILVSVLSPMAVFCQDCSGYYYFDPAVKVTFSVESAISGVSGGKKNEPQLYTYEYTDIKTSSSQCSSKTVFQTPVNKRATKSIPFTYHYQMNGDTLKMPIDNWIGLYSQQQDPQKDESSKNLFVVYPASMEVGQTFEDLTGKTIGYGSRGGKGTVVAEIKNRKVEKKETITTPAGTWEAFKITFDYIGSFDSQGSYDQSRREITGSNSGRYSFKWTEWFVPGFGIIKGEYAWKNEIIGKSVISNIKK